MIYAGLRKSSRGRFPEISDDFLAVQPTAGGSAAWQNMEAAVFKGKGVAGWTKQLLSLKYYGGQCKY